VGRQGGHGAGLFDPSANAFWSQPGNAQRLAQTVLLDVTSITNIGILGGALWVAAGKPAADAQAVDRHAMGGGPGGRPGDGLQLAPGLWLQRGRHAQRHFHRQRARLDLGAAGLCGHADGLRVRRHFGF
jgi:hypothetical protein